MATLAQPKTLGLFKRPSAETGFWSWVTTVDHKRIGILYLWTALFFFLVGGTEAWLLRIQLAKPENNFVSAETFNQLFTMHATTMIFLAVMPLSAAFMNFVMPLQIGARDVAFPRLNAFSYWNYLFGGIFLNSSWFLGGAPNGGWFAYAPLTTSKFSPGPNMDFYTLGLMLLGIGTLASGFNFIVTILNMRAPGMTLMRMPIFSWITLIVSFLIVFSFPAITVALIMLLFDRSFATHFFSNGGANVVFWQHLFWTFGHPEVYILILPAMGIVSEVIPVFSRKPLFGYSVMVFSSIAIGFMGFTVWAHHMFAVGMGPVVNTIFSMTTMAIAIPTGVKILNWLATMWQGRIRFTTPMLFATAFIATFTIGGLSGVMHASAPSDTQQTDTYFIVAHIHYVLIGGALYGLIAGIYYWFPKMFGRMMNEKVGYLNFWLIFIGFNVFAFPFHILGLQGMPRRIYTYAADMGWNLWNYVSTVGVFILAAGLTVLLYNMLVSLRRGEVATADPWDARTIEWTLPSPVPAYNYARLPVIHSRDELWELKMGRIKRAEYAQEGHGIHLPGQSYMPVGMALGLTVFSYGMLYQNLAVSVTGLLFTFICLYGWVFEGEGGHVIEVEGNR